MAEAAQRLIAANIAWQQSAISYDSTSILQVAQTGVPEERIW